METIFDIPVWFWLLLVGCLIFGAIRSGIKEGSERGELIEAELEAMFAEMTPEEIDQYLKKKFREDLGIY